MSVRVNSIIKPGEEMADLKKAIEGEKQTRRSLRILSDPNYQAKQLEILDQQIAALQQKRDSLATRYENLDAEIEESFRRQHKANKRYLELKHRDKIDRIHRLKEKIESVKGENK